MIFIHKQRGNGAEIPLYKDFIKTVIGKKVFTAPQGAQKFCIRPVFSMHMLKTPRDMRYFIRNPQYTFNLSMQKWELFYKFPFLVVDKECWTYNRPVILRNEVTKNPFSWS